MGCVKLGLDEIGWMALAPLFLLLLQLLLVLLLPSSGVAPPPAPTTAVAELCALTPSMRVLLQLLLVLPPLALCSGGRKAFLQGTTTGRAG